MSTLTQDQQQAIATYLEGRNIPSGMGTREAACSIAAINLALTGELTDRIPDCMSPVIGKWIIGIQDSMPNGMRNSAEWRVLLPLAAGTGREHEQQRVAMLLDWTWAVVLPHLTPIAEKYGFSAEWQRMLTDKTPAAARAAAWAARAARAAADAAWAADAADAARAAAWEADDAAAYAAAARAADAAARAAAYDAAARAAYAAADAAACAADAADAADAAAWTAWTAFNPSALLRKLIEVTVPCA